MTNLSIIRDRINKSENGTVFVAVDFVDVSDKTNINAYLARLAEEGLVRRVMRGVYYKPTFSAFLNEEVTPSVDKVAYAIARNLGWSIVPGGDAALNYLGLSTQVPATYVYVSDGAYKEYTYGSTTIQFKKTTNKEVSKLSYRTALTVQAIKALGKDSISESVIHHLSTVLTAEDKRIMLDEAKLVTAWIYEVIKEICRQ
jgi:predicted transcriptional regulator of viral defense system